MMFEKRLQGKTILQKFVLGKKDELCKGCEDGIFFTYPKIRRNP
jgi:hypothetical protein